MATIQSRMCRGHKYWYIVESKRINGKPRPIVIECLGSTKKLIERLRNTSVPYKSKSFSHGAVAAFLAIAKKLNIVSIINKHTHSQREYWPEQPLRNGLTAGITLLLAAIGRACMPTSKQGWADWAKNTSCEHLLRISLTKLDSQHFWDLMDCIPEEAIEKIELEILQNVLEHYPLSAGTLLYDTTNFYTFINSTNDRCEIAQRGKNKQKRNDLRQIGLALAVTQEHYIPSVLVFVSEKLHKGQLRGVYQSLEKRKKYLRKIQKSLLSPRAKRRTKEQLEQLLEKVLHGQFMNGLITYELTELQEGRWSMTYRTNRKKLEELEDRLGFRIVMTSRHDWESDTIIKAFYGQSTVEQTFKNIKNPYHLAVTPQFHWTDHKIKIHYFTCVLGYMLSALIWHDARKAGFCGTLDNLLDTLDNVRLARQVEVSGKKGKPKVNYQLEEMSDEQKTLLQSLNISDIHLKPLKIEGVSVYKSK